MAVVKVNVTVDLEDDQKLKSDSLDILKLIRPGWTASDINWRVFTDGITNKLVGAWSRSDKTDTVLIRVYGCGTEKIIDRNMEMENMIKYRKLGSGSQLYATFNNGICYEFLHGDLLSQATCLLSDVYRSVARGMARLHSVPIDTCRPVMWDRLRQFIGVCSPDCRPRLQSGWWTRAELQKEASHLQKMLQNNHSPVVLLYSVTMMLCLATLSFSRTLSPSLIWSMERPTMPPLILPTISVSLSGGRMTTSTGCLLRTIS